MNYRDVEITVDESAGLIMDEKPEAPETEPETTQEPAGETEGNVQESVTGEPEESTAAVEETVPFADQIFDVDGEKLSGKDLLEARKDAQNKAEWQATNTQRAQEIAAQRKVLDALRGPELKELLKEEFADNPEALKAIDELTALPPAKTADDIKAEIKAEFQAEEAAQREVERAFAQVEAQNKEFFSVEGNTEKFMEFVIDNQTNIETGWKLYSYDMQAAKIADLESKLADQAKLLENKDRNNRASVATGNGSGAKDVKSPQRLKSYRDITADTLDGVSLYEDD